MDSSQSTPTFTELIEMVQNLQKQVDELSKNTSSNNSSLGQNRIYQYDFTPGCIKQRAMGEGNRFVRSGTATNLPTIGETVNTNSSAAYFDTTNNKWYIYNATGTAAWKSVTLS